MIKRSKQQHIIELVIGQKASGKTMYINKRIKQYIANCKTLNEPYRVLVLKCSEAAKVVNLSKVSSFKNKVIELGSQQIQELYSVNNLFPLLMNFKNGLLVIDDYYLIRPFTKIEYHLFSALCLSETCQRHLILSSQTFSIPIKLQENANYITMFKCVEPIFQYKKVIPTFQSAELCEAILNLSEQKSRTIMHYNNRTHEIFGVDYNYYFGAVMGMAQYGMTGKKSLIKSANYINWAEKSYSSQKQIEFINRK